MSNKVLHGILLFHTGKEGGMVQVIADKGVTVGEFPEELAQKINAGFYTKQYPEASEEDATKIKIKGNQFYSEVCKGIYLPLKGVKARAAIYLTKHNDARTLETIGELLHVIISMTSIDQTSIRSSRGKEGMAVIKGVVDTISAGGEHFAIGGEDDRDGSIVFYFLDGMQEKVENGTYADTAVQVDDIAKTIREHESEEEDFAEYGKVRYNKTNKFLN